MMEINEGLVMYGWSTAAVESAVLAENMDVCNASIGRWKGNETMTSATEVEKVLTTAWEGKHNPVIPLPKVTSLDLALRNAVQHLKACSDLSAAGNYAGIAPRVSISNDKDGGEMGNHWFVIAIGEVAADASSANEDAAAFAPSADYARAPSVAHAATRNTARNAGKRRKNADAIVAKQEHEESSEREAAATFAARAAMNDAARNAGKRMKTAVATVRMKEGITPCEAAARAAVKDAASAANDATRNDVKRIKTAREAREADDARVVKKNQVESSAREAAAEFAARAAMHDAARNARKRMKTAREADAAGSVINQGTRR
jgi:hypothetical protein